MKPATVLGVPIAPVDLDEAVEWITRLMAAGGHHQVVTVNPEFLVAARYRPDFGAVLRRAALATADGVGVVLAARLQGTPLRGRVTGTELVLALARRAATEGWRLFLLGAAPGVAERVAEALAREVGGVRIVGTLAGSPRPEDEATILARLGSAQPDLLFVAYGAPAQELWLARNLARTTAVVGMGVGGAFDFLAGIKPRAPRLLQRLGLEWLYRLWREPWRARRMLALPAFVALILRGILARRLLGRSYTGEVD
jgi:N-acetylglucosaminyldiphosphoundecaprenol N-acetyl-beta-D-mannosaminyltransferase